MSTKKIREALRICLAHGRVDGSAQAVEVAEAAENEVEAIEKAAKALSACRAAPYSHNSPRGLLFYPAMKVIYAIAKDAP